MAEAMCPKNCTTDEDCQPNQECCDLKDNMVCLDIGQCPQRCNHSSKECPLGQVCCDAGDDLLLCVSPSECPGSVSCPDAEHTCTNSEGKPDGKECCEVPELGFRCVGSGGCGDWGACTVDTDCPIGRECCEFDTGMFCVPTGACPDQSLDLPECSVHSDCTGTDEICCLVPEQGTYCAKKSDCPSNCLDDSDCSQGICCKKPGAAAGCMTEAECKVGDSCDSDADCGEGNKCCELGGSKTCMPGDQCIGSSCQTDADCDEGSACCDLFGMRMCFPGGCPSF